MFNEEIRVNYDIAAEDSLIAAIINNPVLIDEVADKITPEFFYNPKNKAIFHVMLELMQMGDNVDEITIFERLKNSNTVEKSAIVKEITREYIVDFRLNKLLIASAAILAKRIKDSYILRSIAELADSLKIDSFSDNPVEMILEKAQTKIFGLAETRVDKDVMNIKDIIIHDKLEYNNLEQKTSHFPTGFKNIDKEMGGFHNSDLIILAARPGCGKTSLALEWMKRVASGGKGVLVFSLEMGREQLIKRTISSLSGLPLRDLHMNTIAGSDQSDDKIAKYTNAVARAVELPIWIDDAGGINIVELRTKARRLKAKYDIGLIIVDYLQLISPTGMSQGNRTQEIGEISRGLKILAKDLAIPVIALSQLSRAVEARDDKRPMLSDLRESGCLLGDTLILNSKTGDLVKIEDMAKAKNLEGFYTNALDESLKLQQQEVTKAFSSGVKKVYELTTQSGRVIKASANHKFFKKEEWTSLDQLNTEDYIAIPKCIIISNPVNSKNAEEISNLFLILKNNNYIIDSLDKFYSFINFSNENIKSFFDLFDNKDINCSNFEIAQFFQNLLNRISLNGVITNNKVSICEFESQNIQNDIYWDKIKSIEYIGEHEVYDATVDINHNFIANNIIVHNSIEQDADIVMFIHREELYHPGTEKHKGRAKLIVAKHRNGATGEIDLAWIAERATFDDIDLTKVVDM
jgi:replicative DNA helicase